MYRSLAILPKFSQNVEIGVKMKLLLWKEVRVMERAPPWELDPVALHEEKEELVMVVDDPSLLSILTPPPPLQQHHNQQIFHHKIIKPQ
jgi:hypothetical protein